MQKGTSPTDRGPHAPHPQTLWVVVTLVVSQRGKLRVRTVHDEDAFISHVCILVGDIASLESSSSVPTKGRVHQLNQRPEYKEANYKW